MEPICKVFIIDGSQFLIYREWEHSTKQNVVRMLMPHHDGINVVGIRMVVSCQQEAIDIINNLTEEEASKIAESMSSDRTITTPFIFRR